MRVRVCGLAPRSWTRPPPSRPTASPPCPCRSTRGSTAPPPQASPARAHAPSGDARYEAAARLAERVSVRVCERASARGCRRACACAHLRHACHTRTSSATISSSRVERPRCSASCPQRGVSTARSAGGECASGPQPDSRRKGRRVQVRLCQALGPTPGKGCEGWAGLRFRLPAAEGRRMRVRLRPSARLPAGGPASLSRGVC
eukprot:3664602-Prymnesium_polylepis.1